MPTNCPRGEIVPQGLGIDAIINASFPLVKNILCGGRSWTSPELRVAQDQGRLTKGALGIYVQDENGVRYEISQINVPLIWNITDERRPENYKIGLVRNLLRNAFTLHDNLLYERLGPNGHAIASREYSYYLSRINIIGGRRWKQLYTAIAFLGER